MKMWIVVLFIALVALGSMMFRIRAPSQLLLDPLAANTGNDEQSIAETLTELNPLTIESLRQGNYPGSDMTIEETLEPGSNYSRYIAAYFSEGLKIFALLTVPRGPKPASGWPVVVFNHGFIPPAQYRTTERYVAYVDGFAKNGYIVIKPDYRGHGKSEGMPSGAYGTNGYTIDVLNAVASVKILNDADPQRIGMWGHSLGGFITLRAMVVSNDIKAGVIWAGVVGSYPDLLNNWRRPPGISPFPLPTGARRWRQVLIEQYGTPETNQNFWNSISATSFLTDISGPLQLHHGTGDASVPPKFSQTLEKILQEAGKEVEYFEYEGDDHNLSRNFGTAISRSVEFFNTRLGVD